MSLSALWKIWTDPADSSFSGICARPLLSLASAFYGAAVALRNLAYDAGALSVRRAAVPVISIGNLSVGGAGKTELASWCAAFLKERGKKVCVISRGYKRSSSESEVIIASDGASPPASPREVGDEPAMLARRLTGVPVVVGSDRVHCAELAVRSFGPDVLVLDDGFQHRRLARDLDLLCLDEATFARSRVFPRGVLREPLSQMRRAGFAVMKSQNGKITRPISVSHAVYSYEAAEVRSLADGRSYPASWLSGKRVLAVSAIAWPESFEATLSAAGAAVLEAGRFPDHHAFAAEELKRLSGRAAELGAAMVLTEKDAVKLPERFPAFVLRSIIRWHSGEDDLKRAILKAAGG